MLREITFEEIYPMWCVLWPGRDKIKPVTSMVDWRTDTCDMSLYDKAAARQEYYYPVFYGIFTDDTNELIGVNSGAQTGDTRFRSRGLYVKPGYQGRGLGQLLLQTVIDFAREKDFEVIWSLPKKQALKTYEAVGYECDEGYYGNTWPANGVMQSGWNCYAEMKLK